MKEPNGQTRNARPYLKKYLSLKYHLRAFTNSQAKNGIVDNSYFICASRFHLDVKKTNSLRLFFVKYYYCDICTRSIFSTGKFSVRKFNVEINWMPIHRFCAMNGLECTTSALHFTLHYMCSHLSSIFGENLKLSRDPHLVFVFFEIILCLFLSFKSCFTPK